MIGILSDSHGDLDAFEAAYTLLVSRGARRFLFAGGRYADLDEWLLRRSERQRGGRAYSDLDFLSDVTAWLGQEEQVDRPAAFGEARERASEGEDSVKLKSRFARTPERDSLHYLDPQVPKKSIDLLGTMICCLVHDKNDLSREDLLNASVFVHGREPEPKVVQIGPRFFVTPGRLTGAVEQTCGLLELDERGLRFSAFRLDGHTVLDSQPLVVERRTKLSVK